MPAAHRQNARRMSSVSVSLISFCCVLAGALLGLQLRNWLPEHHLSKASEDTVKILAGLMATLSALVLGLLIASAKNSFDTVNNGLKGSLAKVIVIDHLLAEYGPEAVGLRQQLKQQTEARFNRLLSGDSEGALSPPPATGGFVQGLHTLQPGDDRQRALVGRIVALSDDVRQAHWLVLEQADDSVPTVFLVVIVCWLTTMFISFGLFSPRNLTTISAMFVAALSVATAILLMEEMYRPLDGLISIPRAPLLEAVSLLGR
jgi:hypothetical protein